MCRTRRTRREPRRPAREEPDRNRSIATDGARTPLRCRAPSQDPTTAAVRSGPAGLDLLLLTGGRRIGAETKRIDAPRRTPPTTAALADLALDALYIIYPGPHRYQPTDQITALPATDLLLAGLAAPCG